MRSRGFILIVVLAILGVMAAVAVSLVMRSKASHALSSQGRLLSQARLLARSGFEHSLSKTNIPDSAGLWALATAPTVHSDGVFPAEFVDFKANYHATLSEGSNRININDGLTAGKSELGGAYKSNAIDPWPILGTVTPDESGWINLRVRRLLNAYGDAHKYVTDIGLPPWLTPDPNYTTAFIPTGTAMGDRFKPDTGVLTGLGDVLISNRPNSGYRSMSEIEGLANSWGATHLSNSNFYHVITADLTISSWEDVNFFRLNRECPGWTDDVTLSLVDMKFMDSNPPDLTGSTLWKRHPVALININGASTLVKSAVFAALGQVEYMCEGMVFDNLTTVATSYCPRDTLGRGGVVFDAAMVLENGLDVSATDRKNTFMSMYDSLVLAQALDDYIATNGPIEDWGQFKDALVAVRATKQPYERAVPTAATTFPIFMNKNQVKFDQTYVEETLPHVLSTYRCLPGWLGAPLATLRPFVQEGLYTGNSPELKRVLRSVEDIVYRCHLPKIMFLPGGRQQIQSVGEFGPATDPTSAKLSVTIEIFRRRSARSQTDFIKVTDTAQSAANITIGPEPSGVSPDTFMGVVGLNDRPVATTGTRTHSIAMSFDGNLTESGLGVNNYIPQDSMVDPFNYDGTAAGPPPLMPSTCLAGPPVPSDKSFYKASDMEDENSSMFVWGPDATNLSPFGGMLFSSIGHGPRAEKIFSDSLYWRPEVMLGAANPGVTTLVAQPGQTFGRATMNFWWRNPSGYQCQWANRQMFQLKVWQHEEAFHNTVPLVRDITRPYEVDVHLFQGRVHFQHSNNNPGSSNSALGQEVVYGRELGMPLYAAPFSNPPAPNPPAQPANDLDLMSPWSNTANTTVFIPPNMILIILNGGKRGWAERHSLKTWNGTTGAISITGTTNENRSVRGWTPVLYDVSRPPGSWNRFNASWRLQRYTGKFEHHYMVSDLTRIGAHKVTMANNLGAKTSSNIDHMILSFGERLTGFTTPLFNFQPLGPGNTPDLSGVEPDYLPMYRFNSLIDNIDVRFGNAGGINHANQNSQMHPRKFFDTTPATKTKRYDITLLSEGGPPTIEPTWVIEPKMPLGARVHAIGSRVYDVPTVTSGHNSPWIDLRAISPSIPSVLDAKSDPGATEPYKSISWAAYMNMKSTADLRIHMTYKASDPTGNLYLKNYLSDIPWIKEVFWIYSTGTPSIGQMTME